MSSRADCLFHMQMLLFCVVVRKEGDIHKSIQLQGVRICAVCLSTIHTEYLNANAVYLWFKMYGRFYVITI
jgi:hypothetical protein